MLFGKHAPLAPKATPCEQSNYLGTLLLHILFTEVLAFAVDTQGVGLEILPCKVHWPFPSKRKSVLTCKNFQLFSAHTKASELP